MNLNINAITLEQLHINHMGIEKPLLLLHEYIYWVIINNEIKNSFKTAQLVMDLRTHNQKTNQCHMTYQARCGKL